MLLRILLCALSLAVAGGAAAQTYRWVDKDGKVRYGDTPPPGVDARRLSGPSAPPAPSAAPDASAKDAKGGPLTPAEREQEFQKRRLEAQKAEQKAAAAAKDQEIKAENCRRARESLATLEGGRRILRTNAQGEQYYLEDDARAAETQRAQQAVQDWCN
ncbi:MAG: DUF4124 domain-containing protein [Betaproteobacteria bacterium]|nr:DUF4124 domain-containing protein [Betaproteobacteria bacterium]MDH5221276.1 DUF4124 domain-containing protein [Betaproteobacteria bacterium]MDH5350317.1 DUF4124 domain-containing protein [Betaproteobacteria bacterium]